MTPAPAPAPAAARLLAPALLAGALLLAGCSGGDRGESSETDADQTVPEQSPALAEGDETEGVGPSGGDPTEEGR